MPGVSAGRPTLCVFFDLEATGLYPQEAEILELGATARLLSPGGIWSPVGDDFHSLVQPCRKPPKKVLQLTGLTMSRLQREGVDFRNVLFTWQAWLQRAEHWASAVVGASGPANVWLVAHNGQRYDLPLLLAQDARDNRRSLKMSVANLFDCLHHITGIVDTLQLSRRLKAQGRLSQRSLKLATLHEAVVGLPLAGAHSALGDAIGLANLCSNGPFHDAFVSAVLGGAPVTTAACDALKTASMYASRPLPWRRQSRGISRSSGVSGVESNMSYKNKMAAESLGADARARCRKRRMSLQCSKSGVAHQIWAWPSLPLHVGHPKNDHDEYAPPQIVPGCLNIDTTQTLIIIDDSQ